MSNVFTEEMLAKKMAVYRYIAIFLSILFMATAAIGGVNSYFRSNDILKDHTVVTANITKAEHRLEEGKKGRIKDVYEIFYTFRIGDEEKTDQFKTSEKKFQFYQSNGKLKIAYSNNSPSNYERLELLETQSNLGALLYRLVTILLILMAFFYILGLLIKLTLRNKIGSEIKVVDQQHK